MAQPRILLDLRMVQGSLHGIARYALELARRLPALEPSWTFEALVPPGGLASPAEFGALQPPSSLRLHRARVPFLHPLEQPTLALDLLRVRPSLFHATSFSLPGLWPGRLVATLHDANHLALPQHYGAAQRAYYRVVVGPRAARSNALVTVSDFSRAELARFLSLPPERFQVISNGVDARFRPLPSSDLNALRERLSLPARFVLAVGNEKPHKGLRTLAQVADALGAPVVLLAGEGAAKTLGFPSTTRDLGTVPEEDLPRLYAAASVLAFPSVYEGFGLPALEAMACGTPVVAASGSSLEEVCGPAALFFSPGDATALRDAILRFLHDPRLRDERSQWGLERASRFSWDNCARQTLEVYRRVLAGRR